LVAVDDSTNFTDVSQVALFIRYCNSNSNWRNLVLNAPAWIL